MQVGGGQEHGADARLRVRIDDENVLAEHGRERFGKREHERGFAHTTLGVHDGYGVTHSPPPPIRVPSEERTCLDLDLARPGSTWASTSAGVTGKCGSLQMPVARTKPDSR